MIEEALKELRREQRLTQKKMAEKTGVTKKTIMNWEKGGTPSVSGIIQLCKRLHVSADYILGLRSDHVIDIGDIPESDQVILTAMIQAYKTAVLNRDSGEEKAKGAASK